MAAISGRMGEMRDFFAHMDRVLVSPDRDDQFVPLNMMSQKLMELYVWVAQHRRLDVAQMILDHAPDDTPFYKSLYRMPKTVEVQFLQHILDQKKVSNDQLHNAFWHACKEGADTHVELYLQRGADPNIHEGRGFRHAMQNSKFDVALRLLKVTDVERFRGQLLKTLIRPRFVTPVIVDQLYDFEAFEQILHKMNIVDSNKYPANAYLRQMHLAQREAHEIEQQVLATSSPSAQQPRHKKKL